MLPISTAIPARFATLPAAAPKLMPQRRGGFASFLLAPFRDVDDRPARKIAAAQAEREARLAMSGAAAQHR